MHLLLVDDEPQQRHSIGLGLRRRGYQITEAGSTQDAMNRLAGDGDGIDLVLTDYLMPSGTGLELLKHIRQNHAALSVIIMTAFGDKTLLIDALRNGCNSFIEKPFSIDALIREIKRVETHRHVSNASHLITRMLPRIVHQINNPLSIINASIDLAALDLSDQAQLRRCLAEISASAGRILRINREIIKLGRCPVHKPEAVNLKTLLDACVRGFENLTQLKAISVETRLAEADRMISGNPYGLEQLFNNLILNAIEASDGQTKKNIRLGATVNPAATEVTIIVQDTGCGIAPEDLPRIFSTEFSLKPDGNGLGLAVALGVAQEHHGRIDVESAPERGTTFKVCLPMDRSATARARSH